MWQCGASAVALQRIGRVAVRCTGGMHRPWRYGAPAVALRCSGRQCGPPAVWHCGASVAVRYTGSGSGASAVAVRCIGHGSAVHRRWRCDASAVTVRCIHHQRSGMGIMLFYGHQASRHAASWHCPELLQYAGAGMCGGYDFTKVLKLLRDDGYRCCTSMNRPPDRSGTSLTSRRPTMTTGRFTSTIKPH